MLRKLTTKRAGFTLVEIMIVVAIIALLAAIAVPGFLRARKRSQASKVLNDLRLISSAMDQYAIETNEEDRRSGRRRPTGPSTSRKTPIFTRPEPICSASLTATKPWIRSRRSRIAPIDALSDVADDRLLVALPLRRLLAV